MASLVNKMAVIYTVWRNSRLTKSMKQRQNFVTPTNRSGTENKS